MVTKSCPKCEALNPLATKACGCGYIFISKNTKKAAKDDCETKVDTTDDMIAELEEKIRNVQETNSNIVEKLEIQLVEMNKDNENLEMKLKAVEEKSRKESLSIKQIIEEKVTALESAIEGKYSSLMHSQAKKIEELEMRVAVLQNKVIKLESEDTSSSESSESTVDDDDEEPVANIPTENRFSPLYTTENNISVNRSNQSDPTNPENTAQPTNSSHGGPSSEESTQRNILLLSDSMLRRIVPWKLSQENNIKKRYIRGGLDEMSDFLDSYGPDRIKPDEILIHTGTNDIPFALNNENIISKINDIVKISKQKFPTSRITLSGIMHRKEDYASNDRIDCINRATQEICEKENIGYMDNSHITRLRDGSIDEEVFHDHVHLNDSKGLRKLAANIKRHLNLSKYRETTESYLSQPYRGPQRTYRKRPTHGRRPYSHKEGQHTRIPSYQQAGRRAFSHKEGQVGGLVSALKPLINWLGSLQ